jgi:hypothetical protein
VEVIHLSQINFTHTFAEKVIDVNTVDLGKLRVKELKKILNAWGEDCRGCAEKYDFVSKIKEVKHKHIEL